MSQAQKAMEDLSPSTPLKPGQCSDDVPAEVSVGALLLDPKVAKAWLEALREAYGWRLLGMLTFAQWIVKGFVWGFVLNSIDWLMRDYNIAGPKIQVYKAVIMLPWAMKPVFGLLSDAVPVFGYRKAPYIIAISALAVVCYGLIGFSPAGSLSIDLVVGCLVICCAQASICDLLTEAKYAEAIRTRPEKGPDLMTYVWGGITLGSLCATASVGFILHHWGAKWVYAVCVVPAALVIIPTSLNWLQEERMSHADVAAARARLWEQKEVMFLVFVTGGATLTIAAVSMLQDSVWISLSVALCVSVVVATSFTMVLRPIIGRMNVFFFFQTTCAIMIDGATFYFYTDNAEQYPDGPHFSKIFYTSGLGVLVACLNLVGMAMYNTFMKKWRYHALFTFANVVLCVINCLQVVVFLRLNVAWGIPDSVFVFGQMGAWAAVHIWMWIPGVVLLSHLCPKGLEATMYALLAGCHNLGLATAGLLGAGMLQHLQVSPSGQPNETHQFDNLWKAALIQALAPALTLVIMPWFIPNATQTEKLLDEDASATAGSPWEKLRKRRGTPYGSASFSAA